MARLYEYQGKKLLREAGLPVPKGEVVSSASEGRKIAEQLDRPVALKMQVWLTGRAGFGGIQFAEKPQQAEKLADKMLDTKIKNFVVEKLLVEEKLAIKAEYFVGLIIDDAQKKPVLIFSTVGGTGLEEVIRSQPERVAYLYVDVRRGLQEYEVRNFLLQLGISARLLHKLSDFITKFYKMARRYDARSAEINPLVLTEDDKIYAADCHIVVDDYAVYRHPELQIEVAREFDRPPTLLEKIAYWVEEKDHRGTFYFFQMVEDVSGKENYIGFHGAGGGGSMMSMDAVLSRGFKLANYCDTSGNPAASKVYRAAKIILSQPNIKGYFASGSGVASQEQFHSARGLVKAFHEEKIEIPAVIRLGGNYEEKAIEILGNYLRHLAAKVEGYGRDDSPEFCAQRLEELIEENKAKKHKVRPIKEPEISPAAYSFETLTGKVYIDHQKCASCQSKGCIQACSAQILRLKEGKPILSITQEEAKKGKCTECLACEIYCTFHEKAALYIHLPILGLKEYRSRIIKDKK